jgi:flagellar biosynthesis protein FlhG
MTDDRQRDWETLGLEPGASLAQVRRAYERRRSLYSADSLATYTLLDDEERAAALGRLEDAYQRVRLEATEGGGREDERVKAEGEERPGAVRAPDVDAEPGAYLCHLRTRSGLTLEQVSEVTKVRAALVGLLESEDFGRLPAPVYVRGFVIQYARLLGVEDPEELAASYLARMTADVDDG